MVASLKEMGGDAAGPSKEKSSPIPYDEAEGDIDIRCNTDALQRNLGNRQIQMIAIGGSIGTALFVSIGTGLIEGGPGSLLIAFALYSGLLGLVNNCMAEMTVFMPISSTSPSSVCTLTSCPTTCLPCHTQTTTPSSPLADRDAQAPLFDSLANGLTRRLVS